MVNVTNDAWFGPTSGPYQHLAQARLRAIEFGLPMIRAANSGISAVIDPYGRLVAHAGLGETDVIDAPLPAPGHQTLYIRTIWYSYATVMILLGAAGSLGFGLQHWNHKRHSRVMVAGSLHAFRKPREESGFSSMRRTSSGIGCVC